MPSLAQIRGPSFVYEDISTGRNLLACRGWATPGVRPLYDTWVHKQLIDYIPGLNTYSVQDRPRYYCYPIGCFHAPRDWAGEPVNYNIHYMSPLHYLPKEVDRDARSGRVLFIFDQSQEGNADPGLWTWFYATAAEHGMNPRQFVYMTSDHLAEKSHKEYCDINGIVKQMHVLSTLFNLHVIAATQRFIAPCEYDEWIAAKGHTTKLYNCLNRVLHDHRRWFFLKLLEQDLIEQGMVSMDQFTSVSKLPDGTQLDPGLLSKAQALLPLVVDKSDFTVNHFNDLNTDIYLNSWFSVITETFIDDEQLLLGEKVFKPMMCSSPFIVLSSRGTLARLRELGFQTFPMLWDESYDDLDPVPRMDAIVEQIRKLRHVTDLRSWFAQAEPVLRHNRKLAWQHWEHSRDYQKILAIWQDFTA